MKQRKFKHIFLRSVLFLAVLFALDRSVGLILLTLADNVKCTGCMGEVNKALKSDADVFVLGSSRARNHFDSEVIGKALGKKVYNAGRGGGGLAFSRFIVDLVHEKSNPELFILQIEPLNLMNLSYRTQTLAVADTAPYLDRSEKTKELLYSNSRWCRFKHMSHAFRFNGQLLFFISDIVKKDPFENGYVPLHSTADAALLDKKQYQRVRSWSTEPSQQALDDLRETIRLIQARGSRVVLVSSPRWRKDHLMPQPHNEIVKLIEQIASEENAPYFNILQETHPVFKDPSLFADSAHLNDKGAKIFSAIVGDYLKP